MEGNLVDSVLKQLLWELGGYQALEFPVTEIDKRSRNIGEGHRDPNRGDSDRGCQPKRSIESNKPSNLHNLLVLRKRMEPQDIEDAYESSGIFVALSTFLRSLMEDDACSFWFCLGVRPG